MVFDWLLMMVNVKGTCRADMLSDKKINSLVDVSATGLGRKYCCFSRRIKVNLELPLFAKDYEVISFFLGSL